MKTTRQLSITIGFCLTTYLAFCQLPPSGNPPATNTNARAAAAWYRGGNTSSGNNDNIFGTLWNSPIFTRTANANRMRLNGNTTYAVNGYSQARNGYLLLGYGTGYANSLFANANFGAFSLFHLNGQEGSFV